jgi:hypothetical protein
MKNLLFSLIVMLMTIPLFGQSSAEETVTSVKKNFPQVYAVILKESATPLSEEFTAQEGRIQIQCTSQEDRIKIQCFSFDIYIKLMFTEKPIIPKKVLSDIMIKAVHRYCKDFTEDKRCNRLKDVFEQLDCMMAHMVVDWVAVLFEVDNKIKEYEKLHPIV